MKLGSEENKNGQRLWWGLHLVRPGIIGSKYIRVKRNLYYDNEFKFFDEVMEEMELYFFIRKIKDEMKYVPFKRLHPKDIEAFQDWERRHPIKEIDPEPGEKCIFRDDYLNFKKELMIARFNELQAQPPERDFEEDQKKIAARAKLRSQLQSFFIENKFRLQQMGLVSPFNDLCQGFDSLRFDVETTEVLNIVVEFQERVPGDQIKLKKAMENVIKKPVNIILMEDHKNQTESILDNYFSIKKWGPGPKDFS